MYGLHDYARMIADDQRVEAYVRALEATVRPGCVVVDMGTGTGLLALVACKLGARRVYAIDTNPVIEVGRELARENGVAGQIEFLQEDVRRVTLAERADVVVSDMRGALPLAEGNRGVVAYAREHFLAPHGALIPTRETLLVAVVGSATLYERAVGSTNAGGVTLGAMRSRLCNAIHKDRTRSILRADLATPGAIWATLDYATIVPRSLNGKADWAVARDVVGHGLVLWFDSVLTGTIGFSTAPGFQCVYPQLFLPWTEPVDLRQGDTVSVDLWALPEGEAWGWNTEIRGAEAGHLQYKQSTFLGEVARPIPVPGTQLGERDDRS